MYQNGQNVNKILKVTSNFGFEAFFLKPFSVLATRGVEMSDTIKKQYVYFRHNC